MTSRSRRNFAGGTEQKLPVPSGLRKATSEYKLSRELGIDVCFYRMSKSDSDPNAVITLARIPSMEKDPPY